MRLHKKVLIQKACQGGDREAACYPNLVMKPTPCVVATNGTICAVVPCETEKGDKAGLIPVDALVAAQKAASRDEKDTAHLVVGKRVEVPAADQSHGHPDVTPNFPNWKPAVPGRARKNQQRLVVDVGQLGKLAKALGAEWLELLFVPVEDGQRQKPVRVNPIGICVDPGAYGSIMPISADDVAEAEEKAAAKAEAEADDGDADGPDDEDVLGDD